jgi:hypothetical protein
MEPVSTAARVARAVNEAATDAASEPRTKPRRLNIGGSPLAACADGFGTIGERRAIVIGALFGIAVAAAVPRRVLPRHARRPSLGLLGRTLRGTTAALMGRTTTVFDGNAGGGEDCGAAGARRKA